jgi:predicted amidophosphoribosyltransferase
MTRDRSRCPNCGERVQPLAAGCAICGADLDAKRWDTGPSVLQRVGSWFGAISFGPRVSVTTFVIGAIVVYLLLQLL